MWRSHRAVPGPIFDRLAGQCPDPFSTNLSKRKTRLPTRYMSRGGVFYPKAPLCKGSWRVAPEGLPCHTRCMSWHGDMPSPNTVENGWRLSRPIPHPLRGSPLSTRGPFDSLPCRKVTKPSARCAGCSEAEESTETSYEPIGSERRLRLRKVDSSKARRRRDWPQRMDEEHWQITLSEGKQP